MFTGLIGARTNYARAPSLQRWLQGQAELLEDEILGPEATGTSFGHKDIIYVIIAHMGANSVPIYAPPTRIVGRLAFPALHLYEACVLPQTPSSMIHLRRHYLALVELIDSLHFLPQGIYGRQLLVVLFHEHQDGLQDWSMC